MSDNAVPIPGPPQELDEQSADSPASASAQDGVAADAASRHRDAMARRSRQMYAEVSDVGDIPAVVNPERRASCERDLHLFLQTYFPHSTGKSPFSDEHISAIIRIQMCVLVGGLFLNAFPRGYAKSTISENSVIWALLYGHRRFIAAFGASADAASSLIESIKLELTENELLYEDFPEVCHALRALEGKPQRCASQHHNGELTHAEWTADKLVLPRISGSKAGGGVFATRGMTSAIRGLKHKSVDGTQLRPDFVIIDDPQTDESAQSELQINKRLDVIRKSILKLGGHGRKLAVVMNATVIAVGDLVEQICDPQKFPAWQSQRIKMVQQWPAEHETLWLDDYQKLRNTFDPLLVGDQERAHKKATAFYKRNRKKMDRGAKVTWEHCFDPETELSALQHAYNMLIDDGEDVFASECQNAPLAPDAQEDGLKPEQIVVKERFNQVPMGTVPLQVTRLVSHIDVQGNILFWTVMGFDEEFGGTIVDFGTWPNVDRGYFSLRDVRKSLRAATGADSDAAAIRLAIQRCSAELLARKWSREGGSTVALERIGVDAAWGKFTDDIFQATRESEHASVLLPTIGKFFGAKSERRFEDYKRKPGDRSGIGWRLVGNAAQLKRGKPYLLIDTNRWKTMVEKRFATTPGSPGALMINGKYRKPVSDRLRLLADHCTSQRCIMVEALGRTAPEWTLKKDGRDDHWWDNIVSCHAIAAMIGVREPTAAPVKERKKIKLSELQKQKSRRA